MTKLMGSRKKGQKFDLAHAMSFCSISHFKTSFNIIKIAEVKKLKVAHE